MSSKHHHQKTSSPLTATVTALSHEGRGIAAIEGKTTFIEGALPGEIVTFTITKTHSKFNEGIVAEIITPSANRVTPRCPHFYICGGCTLQHLSSTEQILFKQQVLLEQLQHFGRIQPEQILPPLTAEQWSYRHKARLSVKYVDKKSTLLVGFHEKNGRYVADLTRCEVLHPKVGLLIEALKKLIRQLTIFRDIAQIEVAIADSETALIFRHMVNMPKSDQDLLITFAQQCDLHIYLQPNAPHPVHRIWPTTGDELLHYELPDQQLRMAFYPTDFTQINPGINRQMINLALSLLNLQSSDHVLDLFCGLGNFTLPIAKNCAFAIGIEGTAEMVKRAQYNAQINHINNTEFFIANLAESKLTAPWTERKFDKILLDPPRTGALEIIKQFPRWRPKKIVYVSCNPATLARDAGELVTQGYRLAKAGVMDMFPHTKHVESIALFELK